jgi:hypothetical protein
MAQVVKCLPSKLKVLNSSPSSSKGEKKKRKKERKEKTNLFPSWVWESAHLQS